ncbi:ATP-binding protein [Candidatus Leptofilum sp.]|uniref:ATP-binding protein n=1 Tax=Candidatus Leptofilum sp. TaxID=3241576 RepID=UPI003B5C3E0F
MDYTNYMTENQANTKREVWEQWDWIWHLTSYAVLAILIVLVFRRDPPVERLPLFFILSALLAIWYFPFVTTPVVRWYDTPRRGLLYFLIGFVLWGGLLAITGSSLMLTAMFSIMIFTRFPIRWAIGIMIFLTLGFLLLYLLLYPSENWLLIVLVVLASLFLAVLMGNFITAIAGQSLERQRLIEVMQKNRELEEAYLQQEIMLRHNEKLATLGKLSAGIAHELNNPAAAAQRAAAQLQSTLLALEQAEFEVGELNLSTPQLKALESHTQRIYERVRQPIFLDPLTRSDREYEIESWLEGKGMEDAWEFTPALVNIGYTSPNLSNLADVFTDGKIAGVVALLSHVYETRNLLAEIGQGTGRIVEIVKALKSYSYLDQAPIQSIDIHEGLNNTLVILQSKLKDGIEVRRDYAPELPDIDAFGSELNQAWTNIIDNAIDAMTGQGTLILKTYQEDEWIVVEIADTGPGIPPEIQENIFDPFVTTKPPGEGSGLGLNISHHIIVQKHRGQISVTSKPGQTCFQVKLPIHFEEPEAGI